MGLRPGERGASAPGRPRGVDVYVSFLPGPESTENPTVFGYELLVSQDEPAEEQTRRLAAEILADAPRKTAEAW